MASGSTAMWEGCTNHALLRLHVRPARSIFSDALNFCRTFSAMRAQAGLFTLGQPIDTGPPAPARRLCRDPLRLAESATFVSVLDCEVDIHHCVYCVVLRHRNAVSSQGVMGPHLGFVLSAPKRLPVVVSQGYVPAFMGDSVKLPVGVACRGVDDQALRERQAVPEMTVAAFWLDQDVVPGHTRLRLDGRCARKEGRRYRLRRRAIDSVPFSSLASGKVSRSWSALRIDGLSEIAGAVGVSSPRS